MTLKIFTVRVGELEENCYVCSDEESKKCLIIDPGADFYKIKEVLNRENTQPLAVLLTHGHFDHAGAVKEFSKLGVKAYISPCDRKILSQPEVNLSRYFGGEMPAEDEVEEITEGKREFEPFVVETIFTPGHTKGSVCYKIGDNLFSGDTLFYRGYGRYDFPTGNYEDLVRSLNKLKNMENLDVYPGHGTFTTIEDEKNEGVLKGIQ